MLRHLEYLLVGAMIILLMVGCIFLAVFISHNLDGFYTANKDLIGRAVLIGFFFFLSYIIGRVTVDG